jgi:2-polyprenyl-3-methyl-5-hydroxy-6-metoxy-1,4-benzoquinol methylase
MTRLNKSIDIGGTSDAGDILTFVEFAKVLNPKTVLDVGAGCFGKSAYLLRMFVEHKFRHLYGTNYMRIDGIEAYIPNLEYVRNLKLYNNLFGLEALRVLRNLVNFKSSYDIIVCSHVLEHHFEEDGWNLLSLMYDCCEKGIILACPFGKYLHTDNMNRYQNHLSGWTPEMISKKYPITTPIITRNNVGVEEFMLVIPK